MTLKVVLLAGGLAMCLAGCTMTSADYSAAYGGASVADTTKARSPLDAIAADYIRLTLEAGTHEAEYVDAYYGPAKLQAEANANPRSKVELIAASRALIERLDRDINRWMRMEKILSEPTLPTDLLN